MVSKKKIQKHLKIQKNSSSFLESIFLPFVEQVCFCTSKVYNFWTSISILFHNCTLLAVVCIWHPWPPTNHTATLVASIVALITNAYKCAWTHIGVTDHTLAITLKKKDCSIFCLIFKLINKKRHSVVKRSVACFRCKILINSRFGSLV